MAPFASLRVTVMPRTSGRTAPPRPGSSDPPRCPGPSGGPLCTAPGVTVWCEAGTAPRRHRRSSPDPTALPGLRRSAPGLVLLLAAGAPFGLSPGRDKENIAADPKRERRPAENGRPDLSPRPHESGQERQLQDRPARGRQRRDRPYPRSRPRSGRLEARRAAPAGWLTTELTGKCRYTPVIAPCRLSTMSAFAPIRSAREYPTSRARGGTRAARRRSPPPGRARPPASRRGARSFAGCERTRERM